MNKLLPTRLRGTPLEDVSETNAMTNNDKELDPNLQAPQEANTTKHINFREAEEAATDNRDNTDDSFDDSPTKKAWEELRRDQKNEQSSNS